jgi:glycerol kinase
VTAASGAALGLDLGTTRIKLALYRGDRGRELEDLRWLPAPEPRGDGAVREVDADAYRRTAEALLEQAPPGLPLGIASQRSSFVLWDRGGRPQTPLVSWQDRRAEPWCRREEQRAQPLIGATGLVLSPHYAGPKLAALFEEDADLRARAEAGELFFGTLETYLVWHWSRGAAHETDLSMAARTLLVDLETGGWSPRLCALFGVPPGILGTIAPTHGRDTVLYAPGGRVLTASIADQAAGLVGSLGTGARAALVNLGTGVFCLSPTGARLERRAGYLSGPLLGGRPGDRGQARYALEATINGGGATADRCAPGPTALPARDPAPGAYCLPDENGVGAPFWLARQGFVLAGAEGLAPAERRRVVLEGLVFRVHAALADLGSVEGRVLVAGGLAKEPFVPGALATVLGRPVEVLEEAETTLLGAARLASGAGPDDAPCLATRSATPVAHARWLADKSLAWRAWVAELLGSGPQPR